MPPLPIGQNHDAWARLPNHRSNLQPVIPGVLDATVRNVQRPPPADAKNVCGIISLAFPIFSAAPRTHFAAREIKDACPLPAFRSLEQRAAAGLLHIVAVRGNSEDIQRLTRN